MPTKIRYSVYYFFTLSVLFLAFIALICLIISVIINPTLIKIFICICIFAYYKIIFWKKHPYNPYYLTTAQKSECQAIVISTDSEYVKAMKIFNWMQKNITYEYSALNDEHTEVKNKSRFYKNAALLLETKTGICFDMALLYVSIARHCGIKSVFVASIELNPDGEKINHACAIYKTNTDLIQIDPAHRTFNIHHKKYKILSDWQVRIEMLRF